MTRSNSGPMTSRTQTTLRSAPNSACLSVQRALFKGTSSVWVMDSPNSLVEQALLIKGN